VSPPSSDPANTEQQFAELLSLAVHEFRTPASVVSGYLRMLQRDESAPLSDRQRKMIDEAAKAFARMMELVNEISDIGKLDDGRLALQQTPLDLFALVDEVAKETHEAEDRGVRLEVRGAASGAPLRGDAPRLRAALSALFRAVLREQPAACVVVAERRLSDEAQSAMIAIALEGQVADAFTASRVPFDDKRGGMGLVLPLARRIIERHGGEIWSQPSASGEPVARSGIVVRLPVAS
jgi:signal transduction histidine kinase